MLNQIIRALGFLEGANAITCDSCGKRKKGQFWESDELPGKKFCTKRCLNEYIANIEYEAVDDYDIDKPIVVEEILTEDEHIKKNMIIRVMRFGAVNSKESSWWRASATDLNDDDKIMKGGDLFTDKDAKEKAIAHAKKLAKRYKTNIIKIIEHEAI